MQQQQFKSPLTTAQSTTNDPDAFLNDNFHASQFYKNDTSPHAALQKPWREPIQPPAYALPEPRLKLPSLYALVGATFIVLISGYGFIEICVLMWQAFLKAIH